MTKFPPRGAGRGTDDDGAQLVVVDGSNIATEGRSLPSLAQLNDAVLSFCDEFPGVNVTVVVDATFGHRIDKSEVADFDEAVAHNELVAPPAGAVGRGDAFVLSIANKSGARILSNDSFQEFHGDYPWLFDEGRLIGGKPVPHVGWVFVKRVPVKGPVSRKARNTNADKQSTRRTASKLASQPMPVPTAPPPGVARQAKKVAAAAAVPSKAAKAVKEQPTAQPVQSAQVLRGSPVNELLPFLEFVEHHPVGSSVTGVVESYSSHGAYVTIGDLRGYVPLRLMSSPPPRSAKEAVKLGESVTLVVANFAPARRSVDLALPGMHQLTETEAGTETAEAAAPGAAKKSTARKTSAKKAAAPVAEPPAETTKAAAKKAVAAKRSVSKEPAAPAPVATERMSKKEAAKKAAAKKAAAQPAAAKPGAAKTPAAKKAALKRTAPATDATDTPPAKKSAAKTAGSPKRAATKAGSPKPAATKAGSPKPAATKPAATKAPAKPVATKAAATKPAARSLRRAKDAPA